MSKTKEVQAPKKAKQRVSTSVGELLAAAVEVVGSNPKALARLFSSEEMRRALGMRIIVA